MKKIVVLLMVLSSIVAIGQKVVYHDTFDDDKNKWSLNENNLNSYIDKGVLVMKNTDAQNLKWELVSVVSTPDEVDFDVEATIKVVKSTNEGDPYGLVWAGYNDNSNYRVVNLSPNKFVQLYQYYNKEFFYDKKWETSAAVNGVNKWNHIVVKRRSNLFEVYVNNTLIIKSTDFGYSGSKAGFILSAGMTIEINELKVTEYPKQIDVIETFSDTKNLKRLDAVSTKEYEETNPIISPDGKTIFVTRKDCDFNVDGKGDDIWYSTLDNTGNWITSKNIGKPLNNSSYNFVVSCSPDNNTLLIGNTYNPDGTNKGSGISVATKGIAGWDVPKEITIKNYENKNSYVAYFLTNDNKHLLLAVEKSTGGYGAKDIYVSNLIDDSWSEPVNLGSVINTFDEETNPFLGSDGKTLYFASKGHPGYGGFDLFVSKRLDDSWTNWSKPKNLGNIINSVEYELSLFMSAKGDKIYINKYKDIYEIDNTVKLDPVVLVKGKVYDNKTKKVISAKIEYNNLKNNLNLGTAISNPTDGSYSIVLPFGEKYSFMGNKDGYYAVTENIDLTNLKEYKEIEVDLFLSPIEKGETIRLNNIFFESGKYELLSESFAELDKLYEILKNNSNMKIEIAGHTDAVGSDVDNLNLSNNRAKSVMNYLIKKGVNGNKLMFKGYGETKFIAPNDTEIGKQKNRRVEFIINEI